MKYRKFDDRYFVYAEKNESIVDVLTDFCIEHKIENGILTGIGAIKEIELGAYDPDEKVYTRQVFAESHELISCLGNITLLDGIPFIHAHITIGNHNFDLKGGHLFAAKVAAVGEFTILPLNGNVPREFNEDVGLATWKL